MAWIAIQLCKWWGLGSSGGHAFSDGVTLRPAAVCPAGITTWPWPLAAIIPSDDPLGPWVLWGPCWHPISPLECGCHEHPPAHLSHFLPSTDEWTEEERREGGKEGRAGRGGEGRRTTSLGKTRGSSYISDPHTLETHDWPGSLLRCKLPSLSPTLWSRPRHLHRSQGF